MRGVLSLLLVLCLGSVIWSQEKIGAPRKALWPPMPRMLPKQNMQGMPPGTQLQVAPLPKGPSLSSWPDPSPAEPLIPPTVETPPATTPPATTPPASTPPASTPPARLFEDDFPLLNSPLVDIHENLQKLKEARQSLNDERTKAAIFVQYIMPPESHDLSKLRLHLGSLLTRLYTRKHAPAPLPVTTPSEPKINEKGGTAPDKSEPKKDGTAPNKGDAPNPDFAKALDPLALAQALYRAGNYPGALQAYRLLPQEGLKAPERVPIQYMIACCLRKMGKHDEAAAVYREVANSRGDEQLAACAQWQLENMRWQRDVGEQISQIQKRRQALETAP